MLVHSATLGKSALGVKTYLPSFSRQHLVMAKMPSKALQVLSQNLERLIAAHPELNTQPKLAARAKVDQKTVYRIVAKQNEPSIDKVEKLARALGLDGAWQLLVPNLKPAEIPTLAGVEEHA